MKVPGKRGDRSQDLMATLRGGQNTQAIERMRAMARGDVADAANKAIRERHGRTLNPSQQAQLQNAIKEDRANVRLIVIALLLLAALLVWTFFGDLVQPLTGHLTPVRPSFVLAGA